MITLTKAPPQFGWIRGSFGAGSVDLDFDRRQHKVSGTSFGDQVSLSTENDQVRGSAHGSAVQLQQQWSPTLVQLEGWANGSRYQMTIDYNRRHAEGSSGGQPISLDFDLQQGNVRGFSKGQNVDLRLSPGGTLSGQLGGTVQAEMVNLDVGELISHWYLVTK